MRRVATVSEVAAQLEQEARDRRAAAVLAEAVAATSAASAAAAAARRPPASTGAQVPAIDLDASDSIDLGATPPRPRRGTRGATAAARSPAMGSGSAASPLALGDESAATPSPRHPALQRVMSERRRRGGMRARAGSFMEAGTPRGRSGTGDGQPGGGGGGGAAGGNVDSVRVVRACASSPRCCVAYYV